MVTLGVSNGVHRSVCGSSGTISGIILSIRDGITSKGGVSNVKGWGISCGGVGIDISISIIIVVVGVIIVKRVLTELVLN